MLPPRLLADGLVMGECPRWHDGLLWVCDWPAGEVLTVDASGRTEVVHHVDGLPFSIDWDPTGALLVLVGSDRTLLRLALDGSVETVADLASICDHAWNELVVDPAGRAYANCIGFDMMGGEEPGPGVIAVVDVDGAARQVADDLWFPNGMAVTDDGSTLIVAESHGSRLTAFRIGEDGSLGDRWTWADLGDAAPDGICLDAEGAVWFADVPHRRCVRVAEGGEELAEVALDRGAFACMLGGLEGTTLHIVANDWGGPQGMGSGASGRVVTVEVDVGRAGHP